jgi:hypothetical protein
MSATELEQFKQGTRATWAAGDYHEIAKHDMWELGARIVERAGPLEPGDCRAARDLAKDGRHPRRAHLHQDRRDEPGGRQHVRHGARPPPRAGARAGDLRSWPTRPSGRTTRTSDSSTPVSSNSRSIRTRQSLGRERSRTRCNRALRLPWVANYSDARASCVIERLRSRSTDAALRRMARGANRLRGGTRPRSIWPRTRLTHLRATTPAYGAR